MEDSFRGLRSFIDEEFLDTGAFYSDYDSDNVILGKGGSFTTVTDLTTSQRPTFLLKDFYSTQYLQYTPETSLSTSRSELKKFLSTWSTPATFITTSLNTDATYLSDFLRLKQTFSEQLKKVVLISREEYCSSDPLTTRGNLFRKAFEFDVGMPYGIWNEAYGVIGSSPELLFSLTGQDLKSVALAGTSRKGSEAALLNSPKDRREHDFVIKDILEKLKPFSTFLQHSDTHIFAFRDLIHLKTEIQAQLVPHTGLGQLVGALSPTAALGGYPQNESLEFLKATSYFRDHQPRYFGSAFGITSGELNQFLVSIRNVQWNQDCFYIESGGGVLPDSTLEGELAEIHLKRETIRKHYL